MKTFDEKDFGKKEEIIAEIEPAGLEPIQISEEHTEIKKEHGDDVVLTQCILCVCMVLILFALHWLKPEWQTMLLTQYTQYRDEPPIAWLDQLLQAIQQWMQK